MEPWNSSSDPQMASGQMAVQPGVPFRPHQVALFVEIIAALQKLLLELVATTPFRRDGALYYGRLQCVRHPERVLPPGESQQ